MKSARLLLLSLIFFLSFLKPVLAENITCDNRYLTLVNPIRSRDLWFDHSLEPINSQINLISSHQMSATWLVQYDTLKDQELTQKIKSLNKNHEVGLFLEISNNLTNDAKVIYPTNTPWFKPNAVFLSGYSQSDRKKLIDTLVLKFKNVYGFFPKSVGAWWIDSYSLNYLVEKYGITAAMIVADQKTTDNYGVWGQWWGVPYYPSKANILTPARDLDDKQPVTIIQWAQRDPKLGVGEGPLFSNYSIQANDYIRQGKNTSYFNDLIDSYLDCANRVGQITVGLETGIESVGYINEYENQLNLLSKKKNLHSVTMRQFAENFAHVYPDLPQKNRIIYQDSIWDLSIENRTNNLTKEKISYSSDIAFYDYFLADKSEFLDRKLPGKNINEVRRNYDNLLLLIISVITLFIFKKKKKTLVWLSGTLFYFSAFGLIVRSGSQFGWQVFYGPIIANLLIAKFALLLVCLGLIWIINKKFLLKQTSGVTFLIPLSFAVDPLIQAVRYIYLSNFYYLGFFSNNLHFFGIKFSRNFSFQFINQDFSSTIANSFLKFNFGKIWDNLFLSILVYPLIHLVLVFCLILIVSKFSPKARIGILLILTFLLIWHFINIFQTDPRKVLQL